MKKTITCLLVALVTASCCNELAEIPVPGPEGQQGIVLQQRDPRLPGTWARTWQPTKSKSDHECLPAEKYMGRAYHIGNTIVGDIVNVGLPVIDIERLQKKHPTYITSDYTRTPHTALISYSSLDRYQERSALPEIISRDFNLNPKVLKLEREKSTTEKFHDHLASPQRSAWGEIEIEVRHRKHELQTISSARKQMAANFLHEEFLNALYHLPMQEIIDQFGLFVITKYYSGGRASALYYGITSSPEEENTRERSMHSLMNVACKWTPGRLEFGKEKYTPGDTTRECNFAHAYYTVSTQGGTYTQELPVQNAASSLTNLSPWLQSLDDEGSHVLAGFLPQGLHPVSNFILEENFKQRINDTHSEYITSPELHEPFIEIAKVYVRTSGGEALYKIAPVLHTRQGDLLVLNDGLDQSTDAALRANNDDDTFMQRANTIAAEKGQYYQCRIEANPTRTLNPISRTPLNFDISALDESRAYKFKHPDTGMWYIYDPTGKIAYAYYLDEYIPDVYGMLDWINSIPEKNISIISLYQLYRIMGL